MIYAIHFSRTWRSFVFVLLSSLVVIAIIRYKLSHKEQEDDIKVSSSDISFNRMRRTDDTDLLHLKPLKAPSTNAPVIKDIYQLIDQKPAGQGSAVEEFKRIKLYLATQGAICQDIRRIGGSKVEKSPRPYGPDGAWDVCFDQDVGLDPNSCIVYSIGIAADFSFDDGMATYGCQVFSFDPTTGKPDHKHADKVTFFNTGLSDHDQDGNGETEKNGPKFNWKTRTLNSIIEELHHQKEFIDILKMDIESNEWLCLPQMLKDGTLRHHVRQLIVEFHIVSNTPEDLRKYYSIIKWLEQQGMRVTSAHRNPYCLECFEMTFINTAVRGKRKPGD